jgi:hypothetical protein
MPTKLEIINQEFREAVRLKELARKSTKDLDQFIRSAEHAHQASVLSFEIADDATNSTDEKVQAQVFGCYYSSEEHSCLGSYYYEKRQITEAKTHIEQCLQNLTKAISLIDSSVSSVSQEVAEHLKSFLPGWKYMQYVEEASLYAADARRAWDRNALIDALDFYRRAAEIQQDALGMARKNSLNPAYYRIAVGNYIGMMANASNTLARIIIGKGTIEVRPDTTKVITSDAAIDLLRYALEAYKLSKTAFDANPEWDQYREGAEICLRNIQLFLRDNLTSWLEFYMAFENEPTFLRILRMTDLQQYKTVEIERHFRENKIAKLWLVGGFWIFALAAITGLILLVTSYAITWWQLLLALSAIETLLLVIIASTLRPLGDLSEEGFLKLIRLALKYQLKVFRMTSKPDEQQQGRNT